MQDRLLNLCQSVAAKQLRLQSLRLQQSNRFFVKRHKRIAPQPAPLKRNHAVCKVASRFQHGQARFHGGPIHLHIGGRC